MEAVLREDADDVWVNGAQRFWIDVCAALVGAEAEAELLFSRVEVVCLVDCAAGVEAAGVGFGLHFSTGEVRDGTRARAGV